MPICKGWSSVCSAGRPLSGQAPSEAHPCRVFKHQLAPVPSAVTQLVPESVSENVIAQCQLHISLEHPANQSSKMIPCLRRGAHPTWSSSLKPEVHITPRLLDMNHEMKSIKGCPMKVRTQAKLGSRTALFFLTILGLVLGPNNTYTGRVLRFPRDGLSRS